LDIIKDNLYQEDTNKERLIMQTIKKRINQTLISISLVLLTSTMYASTHKEYYADGHIKLNRTFKDGKLNGLSTVFSESGAILAKIAFKDGKGNGLSTLYYQSGAIKSKATFKDGKLKKVNYANN
jgi:hypothetical protein